MKKVIPISLALTIGFILTEVSAQPRWSRANNRHYHQHYHQPQQIAYYFYPSANVYYNPINRNYFYPRNGVWVSVDVLPRNIYLQDDRYTVYCDENEPIWRNNSDHCHKYGRTRRRSDVVVIAPPPPPRRGVNIVIGARF